MYTSDRQGERALEGKAKTGDRRGFIPMQLQQHGDLSTMPAANTKSGRVQTMFEGIDPAGQSNNSEEDLNQNEMEALLRESASPITIKRGDVVEGVIVRI